MSLTRCDLHTFFNCYAAEPLSRFVPTGKAVLCWSFLLIRSYIANLRVCLERRQCSTPRPTPGAASEKLHYAIIPCNPYNRYQNSDIHPAVQCFAPIYGIVVLATIP